VLVDVHLDRCMAREEWGAATLVLLVPMAVIIVHHDVMVRVVMDARLMKMSTVRRGRW
jgi:hypothetical protein